MSSSAVLTALQVIVPDATVIGPAIVVLLSGGVVGMSIKNMFDSILFDESDPDGDVETGFGDTDGLMGDEGGSNFGGFGGLDGDDEMVAFGDDEFADMDDASGVDTDELEHRLEEMETEVGSLSSTVSTVRTENEQISESVQDVEENVRKLLDIYEMVTRGVNPFADDIEAGLGGGMDGDSSFGLFDDGTDQPDDDIDEDIVNADAEGFFDEELIDDVGDGDSIPDEDLSDVFSDVDGGLDDDDNSSVESGDDDELFDDDETISGDDDEFDDDDEFYDDYAFGDSDAFDDGESAEGGKSFQELKDEYESGTAEWADGDEPPLEGDDRLEDDLSENDQLGDDLDEDDLGGDDQIEDDVDDDLGQDELFDDVIEGDRSRPESIGRIADDDASDETESAPATGTISSDEQSSEAGKPYLTTLPSGFAGDLVVIEWLEYLLSRAGYRGTARAIDYYETIDWIHDDVATDLHTFLRGFDGFGDDDGGLTIDHHTQSLQYISQLDGNRDQNEAVLLSKLVGGGDDGLQR